MDVEINDSSTMNNNTNSGTSLISPCYFCNETIDERYLSEHVQHCGAVLEECPEKCGSYVPRRNSRSHRRNCPRRIQRENNISPHGSLKVTNSKNEMTWRDNVIAALNILRSSISEGEHDRNSLRHNLTIILRRLDTEGKSLELLTEKTSEELHEVAQRNIALESKVNKFEAALSQSEKRTFLSFREIAQRLDSLETCFENETRLNAKTANEHEIDIQELKRFVAKESAIVADLWDGQEKRLNDLKLELEIRCKISKELENKQDLLSEKIDIIVNEIRGHADEIRKQGERLKKLKIQGKEMMKLLKDLVDNDFVSTSRVVDSNQQHFSNGATNGRLLWRIDRYKEKMTEAKENDTVIYSPIFHSKDYGYSLRMELFMNGRRQWRGRHIIGSLRVVEGPWDPLLDWPCVLRASVTLRDQENPANDIRKIVKTKSLGTNEKCDSYDKDSGLDMFIPHTSLTRYSGFTKNDAIFLDVQITDLRESLSMSSLVA